MNTDYMNIKRNEEIEKRINKCRKETERKE